MPRAEPTSDFERLTNTIRPKLHRYCARMAGSSIDGEDIVQDTMLKAMQTDMGVAKIADPEAWLFRIAHNTAIDFLRRRLRLQAITVEGADEQVIADPDDEVARHEIAALGLRPFMKLSPAERSSVILMDVIGHSLREIAVIMDTTVPAVKAALHRGRARLASLVGHSDVEAAISLSAQEHAKLANYVDRFNARDFDAVRDMLADDVRLELVNRITLRGKKDVGRYFTNYDALQNWYFTIAQLEGRIAVLSSNPLATDTGATNFILLEWRGDRIISIKDYFFSPYVLEGTRLDH
jgi:RNA polymerase sigma-70 factor (ECF subfamily)